MVPLSACPALEANGLTVSFSTLRALEDISFQAPAQQMVGIIGPNGAGKTTFIKAILVLLKVDKTLLVSQMGAYKTSP